MPTACLGAHPLGEKTSIHFKKSNFMEVLGENFLQVCFMTSLRRVRIVPLSQIRGIKSIMDLFPERLEI